MTELQAKIFEIFKEFVRVCEEHHLTYFVVGGTAIGTVRHKGFIPWDDDVDVAMPREDYEKFLALDNPFSDKKYFLQTFKTDPHYPWNFAKIRDSSTTYIEGSFRNVDMNHGVWLDIFPLDGISKTPKDPKKLVHHLGWAWHHNYMMRMYAKRKRIRKQTWLKDLWFNIYAYLFFWTNVGHWRNKYQERRCLRHKTSECEQWICYYSNFRSRGITLRKWWLGPEVYGEFEGMKVRLPADYHTYLTYVFGDYMKLPPENKRCSEHKTKHISVTQGYKEYMKEHKI